MRKLSPREKYSLALDNPLAFGGSGALMDHGISSGRLLKAWRRPSPARQPRPFTAPARWPPAAPSVARAGACPGDERGEEEPQEPGPGEGAGVRAGEGTGDRAPGGGGLGGSPCSSRKASRSTYSTSPKGKVRSHSSGAKRLGPAAGPERPRGDPPPPTAPVGASAGPAVSRPGAGTGAEGRVAFRSFSFRRPVGQGETEWDGDTQEEPQVTDKV